MLHRALVEQRPVALQRVFAQIVSAMSTATSDNTPNHTNCHCQLTSKAKAMAR